MQSPSDDGPQHRHHSSKSSKNKKKNRQNYTGSKMPNPLSFNSSRVDESPDVLQMITGETSIYLNDSTSLVYSPSNLSYDRGVICRPDIWHQVYVSIVMGATHSIMNLIFFSSQIHHNGEYTKNQILKSFYNLLHEEEFYPIAYRVRECLKKTDKHFINKSLLFSGVYRL
jgi:hypothetical protein